MNSFSLSHAFAPMADPYDGTSSIRRRVTSVSPNPKPGAPLGQKERELAAQIPHSSTITEAGARAGMSRQAAHDAYEALKIKAPMRCAQLGIRRDRVLQRFDEWAESATKFQRMDQYSTAKEIPDVRARIKANDCQLRKMSALFLCNFTYAGRDASLGWATRAKASANELTPLTA